MSDRDYWAWRTKDFNNGGFQCLIYTVACIKYKKNFSEIYTKYNQEGLLDNVFAAVKYGSFKELEKSGGSQESFPNENSFCVTATLLFDLISAIEISNEIKDLSDDEFFILKKSAEFVSNNIEKHAKISNHLLTGLACLIKYSNLIDSKNSIVEKGIFKISSSLKELWNNEGWLEEYGGADIGYLTLSLQYLLEIDTKYFPEKEQWIGSIYSFLIYFFHLDGSIGNIYGSRGSSIIYPAGFLQSKDKVIYNFFLNSFKNKKIPLQNDLDDTNFVPFLNSLVRGVIKSRDVQQTSLKLPISNDNFVKVFDQAGFVIVKKNNKQTIIDLNKAGIEFYFSKDSKSYSKLKTIYNLKDKKFYCTLKSDFKIFNENKKITINISSKYKSINSQPLKSIELVISRLLIPIFKISPRILNYVKKIAVSQFFSPGKSIGKYSKNIIIKDFEIISEEEYSFPSSCIEVEGSNHHPIKMASQNYLN